MVFQIKKWWPIIAIIFGGGIAWGTLKATVNEHEVKISGLDDKLDKMDSKLDRLIGELLDKK